MIFGQCKQQQQKFQVRIDMVEIKSRLNTFLGVRLDSKICCKPDSNYIQSQLVRSGSVQSKTK